MQWLSLIVVMCGSYVELQPHDSRPQPIVIAHRGASGYAVEHTEAAKAIAHAQNADYIEQDVVLSKDRQFIVSHDVTMEDTTDVETKFPNRARADNRYYWADFDWAEIQQLTMHERALKAAANTAISNRFPGSCGQHVLRLEDEIQLIQGLNATTGKSIGFYIELKGASHHRKEFGLSMGEALLPLLAKFGIDSDDDKCFIQCFEPDELIDLHDRLHCPLPLIQLMGRVSEEDLIRVSRYAKGIGPSLEAIAQRSQAGVVESTGVVEAAHKLGLQVHPYTVRKSVQPRWSTSLEETHHVLLTTLRVDGFFTDYPDLGRSAVDECTNSLSSERTK